jgi:hypothetical protein
MDTNELKAYVDTQVAHEEKARLAFEISLDKRLKGMNEIRESMRDQASKYLTREEFNLGIKALEADIRVLRDSKSLLEGKASQGAVLFTGALGIIAIILSIIKMF